MQAVISGRAGTALLIDGQNWTSLHADDPAEAVPRHAGDFPFLFGDARDLQFLDNVDRNKVTEEFEIACDRETSLHLALFVLDADLPSDVREEAACELNTLLKHDGIAEHLESILYAQPLPESADVTGATEACRGSSCELVAQLLERVLDCQSPVREVRLAWNRVPIQHFGTEEDHRRAEAAFVREGLFRRFVVSVSAGETVDGTVFACLNNPRVQAIHKSRRIVAEWVSPFRDATATVSERPAHAEEEGGDAPEKRSKPKRRSFDRKKILELVELKKVRIVEAMDRRDFVRVWNLVEELINYHSKYGGAEFACKSLCDLAKEAKQRGLSQLQLELATKSVDLGPVDAWSHTQFADALLCAGRARDALEAFDSAIAIDGNVVAQSGRAETLKTLGQLDQALATYDAVIREHPEDVVAKNGRAETLKTLGQLDEALAAYDAVIQERPENVFAKNGRAEILKARGQFDEALAAYDAVIQEHPEDVVAKCGRAETLKTLGRLDEALAAYEDTMREHPEDQVARNGCACVLAAMGRWDQAKALVPTGSPVTEYQWIGYHVRGMILLRTGQCDAAVKIFEEGVRDCPRYDQKAYFTTALALARVRESRYEDAAEILSEVNAAHLRIQTGYLRVQVAGELQRFGNAAEAYRSLPSSRIASLRELREELRVRYVDRVGRQQSDEWCFDRQVDAILLAA